MAFSLAKSIASNDMADSEKVTLTHPNGSVCEIFVAGGHLSSWKTPTGAGGGLVEQIFLSSATKYLPAKPIRGGVPICFPQFGSYGPGGKHGFARNSDKWTAGGTSVSADGNQAATLCLVGDGSESEKWPHPFELRLKITLGAYSLQMGMEVENTGSNEMSFTCLLHTYFRVQDVRRTFVTGFKGAQYVTENEATKGTFTDQRDRAILEGETDRIYMKCGDKMEIEEEGGRPGGALTLKKEGFSDVVLWNIWEEGATGMSDLGEGEWVNYVCVEVGQICEAALLAPNATWAAGQTLEVAEPPAALEERVIQILQDRIAYVKAENAELLQAAEDDSDALPPARNRKMSLQGTGDENKSLAEVAMGRKMSQAAIVTEKEIQRAPAEDRLALLVESMRQQWRNKVINGSKCNN
jgi:glucose-6-phosphate 1-epimerase